VVFAGAIVVKVSGGQVTNRPIYVAIGVTVNGERDILGLWAGDGHEGAKFWLAVLTEIKNRGVEDVCILVCDGLKGLPDSVSATWPLTTVQTCLLHLIRNTFRYASRKDSGALGKARCGRSTPHQVRPRQQSGSRTSLAPGEGATRP